LSRRWPVSVLEQKKLTMGTVEFESQYIGDPMPSSGQMFQPGWFKRFYDVLPEMSMRVFGVDSAWKLGAHSDFSACVYAGIDKVGNIYLIDAWHEKLLYPRLKARVRAYFNAHKPTLVAIEDAASGQGLIEEFIAEKPALPVKRMKATDSKESRAATLSVHWENGKIFLPRGAPWLNEFVEEFLRFGARGSRHDDYIDACELAVRALHIQGSTFFFGGLSNGPR
jgi:predicted phage terminase large subunit-like protein